MNMTHIEHQELEVFNEKFDRLTADKDTYADVIEMLIVAIHSEPVQRIITDKYLEHKGYDLDSVGKRGVEFIKNCLEETTNNYPPKSDNGQQND